jgi:hypothetical protein
VTPIEALGLHNPTDKDSAYYLARIDAEWEEQIIPTGVYYHIEQETFHERLGIREPLMRGRSLDEAKKLLDMFA